MDINYELKLFVSGHSHILKVMPDHRSQPTAFHLPVRRQPIPKSIGKKIRAAVVCTQHEKSTAFPGRPDSA